MFPFPLTEQPGRVPQVPVFGTWVLGWLSLSHASRSLRTNPVPVGGTQIVGQNNLGSYISDAVLGPSSLYSMDWIPESMERCVTLAPLMTQASPSAWEKCRKRLRW